MDIQNVFVIGAGQMGSGIAQVFAQSGFRVILHDMNESAVDRGINSIQKLLLRAVEKERITEENKEAILSRITLSTDLQDARNTDLVVEAVIENIDVKKEIFTELDKIAPADAILATNTSSLPITDIASVTNRPEKVIGMHFMNPVPVMKLVEIIRAIQTDEETYETIAEVTKKLYKTSVQVNDFPGFVANRILMPMINEAIYTVYEGVATIEDVDTVMKLGMNHPMGPLTLADFIGLDTCLYIMEVLHDGFGDSKYRPCPLLRQYVQAGWYGKKTGRGFYTYD
ncbi:3-hydroxybutyryl-CoA dehydrogenase [Pseudogracilibacillus auburnensis]|uniref:3-hydroxybutyryl-CoA dehydrogenase n=1 Tax=Pseudogracilibacillus auburnensis TaxID=1494959 RepID=A0A2V3W2I5_9BACI|nr:3-hydroxybutyryl-CoA dehydrogenase [Pseudogracilibacillus auburnensis]PXW87404.1 3-hydroxybutyryl-CoA dehydrogenase [Pseudogracilibacillus auburnensis]